MTYLSNPAVGIALCFIVLIVAFTAAYQIIALHRRHRAEPQRGAHRIGRAARDAAAEREAGEFTAELRGGEPNRFPSLLAAPEPVPSSPPPSPEPPPVPPVPFLGSLAAAPVPFPVAVPLEPLPPLDRREVSAMPARSAAGMNLPAWSGPAMTDTATGTRELLEADRMAGVLAALKAWTPQPAVPQEPASLAELVRSAPPAPAEPPARPVPAADETGELAFAPVMELGDVDEFVRRTFAAADAGVAAVVAEVLGSGDGRPRFAGASLTGLPEGGWDWHAPLLLPGGYRRAAGAQEDGGS